MIKFYNSESVYSSCVKKLFDEHSTTYINQIVGQKYVGKLLNITGPIDRRGTFGNLFDYTPLPKNFNTDYSFSDVALQAAENIWKSAENKTVSLLWSGGIDSTTALVALMQTNSKWKQQIKIITSNYAISQEYPLFFQKFLNENVNVLLLKNMEFFEANLYNEQTYVVDGSCGDQIWGCNILRFLTDIRTKPFTLFFKTPIFDNYCYANKKLVSQYIEEVVEQFPVKITTISHMFWMLTFIYKWDHVRWRHMSCVRDPSVHHNMHNFFNTELFQKWAMSNLEKKIGDTWNTYKQPAKDFIYEFTNDEDYRVNKLQHESLGNSIDSECRAQNVLYYYKLITDKNALPEMHNFDSYL